MVDLFSRVWASFRTSLGVVRGDRGLYAFVVILLVTDLLWILYHGVGRTLYEMGHHPSFYDHESLIITTDGSIRITYAKELLIVVLLVRLVRLAVLFSLVLLDDALRIHEAVGQYLARLFDFRPPAGLRPGDVGEVMFWSMLGALFLPAFLIGLFRSTREHREIGLAFLLPFGALPFGALLFSAGFVDQLYGIYHDAFLVAGVLLDIAEDGGEMVGITVIAAVALGAERRQRNLARVSAATERPGD